MGAFYMISKTVTAALSEEAKHFAAQTMYPGRHTHTDSNTQKPTDTMHIDMMKGTIYQTTGQGRPEDV